MKRIFLMCMLAALAACDSVNDPDARPDVDLDFAIQRPANEPLFMVSRDGDDIIVRGFYEALCTPYVADARAEVHGSRVILTIAGREPDPGCFPAVVSMGYQAVIQDVDDDVILVRVVHEWTDANRTPETVYDSLD